MNMEFELRPITDKDLPLLKKIYASTREEELAQVDWGQAQKDAFIDMQFNAQHKYYQDVFKGDSFDMILREGAPIGRLYISRKPKEIRIIDIALLPEQRGKGYGRKLLETILEEGQQKGLPVSIHVEHFNPALKLYKRLGFKETGDTGVYYLMEWQPNPSQSATH